MKSVIGLLLFGVLLPSCASGPVPNDKPLKTAIVDVPAEIKAVNMAHKARQSLLKNSPPLKIASTVDLKNAKRIVALSKSTVEIHGDSSLRKYMSRATKMGVRVAVEPPLQKAEDLLKEQVSEFILVIPVADLQSGTKVLDEHLREVLKEKEFPEIRGVVKSYKINGENATGQLTVTASVELTIGGVSKVVPVEATLSLEGKTVRVQGEKQVLMTDFNIKPPTLMLGTIKTANAVSIHFNFFLELSETEKLQ